MAKARKKKIRYSYAISKKICELIESKMTLTKICELPDMPDRRSVHRWRHEHQEFDIKFRTSESIRLSFLVDEMIDITDVHNNTSFQTLENKLRREPTKPEVNSYNQQLRLRVDTIKFLSANLYGPKKADIDLTVNDKVINVVSYDPPKSVETANKLPDLQPAYLKNASFLTLAQQAQVDLLKPK